MFWDFGGVLTTSPFEAFARYERERGLPEGFLRSLNATNPDTNAWARLERSEVTLEEFARLYEAEARAAGAEIDALAVLELLRGDLRPAMVEALRRCAERLTCVCITNNFEPPGGTGEAPSEVAGPMSQVMDLFHHVIESSKAGVRKPDPRIYEMACEIAGVTPDAVVMLDDLGINLKPARAMGMTTIKVVDPEVAIAELEAVVGFPLR